MWKMGAPHRDASWTIRRALAKNLEEINAVVVAAKAHWDQPQPYLRSALALLRVDASYLARNLCFEVTAGGSRVVCFFAVAGDGGKKRLDHLWVRPDHHRLGIGRLACEHVFALARMHRWPDLLVIPEPRAEGFYRTLGFADTGMRVDSRVEGGPTFAVFRKRFDDVNGG